MNTNIETTATPEIFERAYDGQTALVLVVEGGVKNWFVCELAADGVWNWTYCAGNCYEDAADVFSIYNDDFEALVYMFNRPADRAEVLILAA